MSFKDAVEKHPFIVVSLATVAAFGLGWGVPEALRRNAMIESVPKAELDRLTSGLAALREEQAKAKPTIPPRSQRYCGTFRDMHANKSSYTTQEDVALTFSPRGDASGIEVIQGSAEGKVADETGKMVTRTWEVSGYKFADNIVISYFTTKEQDASGCGVYYLKKSGRAFVGYWMGRESISGEHIKCAYVLTDSKISIEDAEKTYSILKSPAEVLSFGTSAPATPQP